MNKQIIFSDYWWDDEIHQKYCEDIKIQIQDLIYYKSKRLLEENIVANIRTQILQSIN
jgi:hypothetical protein